MANKRKQRERQEKARVRADEIAALRYAARAERTGTTKEALEAAQLAYKRSRRRHYGLRISCRPNGN